MQHLKKYAALALLATGFPLMLWSSTLSGSASCRLIKDKIVPIGKRSDAYPLQLIWALSAGLLVTTIVREELQSERLQPTQIKAEVESIPLSLPEPTEQLLQANDSIDIFSLDKTQKGKHCDRIKHVMILGSTDDGKTTLARFLPHVFHGSWIVIDPHSYPTKWDKLPVVGNRDFSLIGTTLSQLTELMIYRYQQYHKGQLHFEIVNIIIDEFLVISTSEECKDAAKEFLIKIGTEARKVGIRLIFLTHTKDVKSLNMEGQGQLRENFNVIRCSSMAKNHAQLKKLDCYEQIKNEEFCYLFNERLMRVPDLSNIDTNYQVQPLPAELRNLQQGVPDSVSYQELEFLIGGNSHGNPNFKSNSVESLPGKELPQLPHESAKGKDSGFNLEKHPQTELPNSELPSPVDNLPNWFLTMPDDQQYELYREFIKLKATGLTESEIIKYHWMKGGKYYQTSKNVVQFLEAYYGE